MYERHRFVAAAEHHHRVPAYRLAGVVEAGGGEAAVARQRSDPPAAEVGRGRSPARRLGGDHQPAGLPTQLLGRPVEVGGDPPESLDVGENGHRFDH